LGGTLLCFDKLKCHPYIYRRATEELESSQAIQNELHSSLDSALDRLKQLYDDMQEVRVGACCFWRIVSKDRGM
jgi:hypothetical protein